MKAMPTMHWQPSVFIDEMKGCGGCHKVGLKTEAEIKDLRKTSPGFRYGIVRCLPYTPYFLYRRSEATSGLPDVPHGF